MGEMIGDLSPAEMEKLLHMQMYGHLGCYAEGEPYIIPILYAYDRGTVYCHTYEGKKAEWIRTNPRVCFQVEEVKGLRSWESVMAWGRCEELTGKEATRAIILLSEKVSALLDRGTDRITRRGNQQTHLLRQDGRDVILYRIVLEKMTGRFERT